MPKGSKLGERLGRYTAMALEMGATHALAI